MPYVVQIGSIEMCYCVNKKTDLCDVTVPYNGPQFHNLLYLLVGEVRGATRK